MANNGNFDWLSDPLPAFQAQTAWNDGSYANLERWELVYLPSGDFSIAAGAALLSDHIRRFRFSPEIIQRMGHFTDHLGRSVLTESFLNYLQRMRLKINIYAALEGTLLLPGQPLLIIQGPKLPVLLLESALRNLCLHHTIVATQAALNGWEQRHYKESAAPDVPVWEQNPDGWKKRACYVGGGTVGADQIMPALKLHAPVSFGGEPLSQIRRLYQGEMPVGDVWLTRSLEATAGISKSSIFIEDAQSGSRKKISFTRFQNLYQPLVLGGRPVWTTQALPYLRQRTFKQMHAFRQTDLAQYPSGWLYADTVPA